MANRAASIMVGLMVATGTMTGLAGVARGEEPWRPESYYMPLEVLVFPHEPEASVELAERLREMGYDVLMRAPVSGMLLVAVPMVGLEDAMTEWMRTLPEVRTAERNIAGETAGRQPDVDCPWDYGTASSCMSGTGLSFPALGLTGSCSTSGFPDDEAFCLQWGLHNTGQEIKDRTCSSDGGSTSSCWEQTAIAGIDVNLLAAWERTTGSEEVVVAVLDSGTEYCNPDFDPGRFFYPDISLTCIGSEAPTVGYPCCDNNGDCEWGVAADADGHGTIVASLIGATADNEIGIAGVDQECRILSARVFGNNATSTPSIPQVNYSAVNTGRLIVALERIHDDEVYNDVRVINISFITPAASETQQYAALETAFNALVAENRFIVCGAGNSGVGTADNHAPACFGTAITVGGIDGRGYRFSTNGPDCNPSGAPKSSSTGSCVDFVAPGIATVSLICQSNPCPGCPTASIPYTSYPCSYIYHRNFLAGTSFATPVVAGAVSLILGRAVELGIVNPNTWVGLTWADMYHILKAGARDQVSHVSGQTGDSNDTVGKDAHYGWGLIDIDASIEYLETHYPCSNPPC